MKERNKGDKRVYKSYKKNTDKKWPNLKDWLDKVWKYYFLHAIHFSF